MNLPKSWNEIDVIQFKEIRELYAIEEVFTREIEILAALADIPSDDLEDLDITEVSDMLKDITFINSEPSKNYKHVIG
jgi:ribosomal silencing factor RsfS